MTTRNAMERAAWGVARAVLHIARSRRTRAALLLVAFSACGTDEGMPSDGARDAGAADGSASDAACSPQSAAGFSSKWRPPDVMLQACSDQQIADQYRLCHDVASNDPQQCTAFNRDPRNARCRGCLYSTEDESSYGPMVIFKNRVLTANVAGCIALVDGSSDTGCGAAVQAFNACKVAICQPSCATYEDFDQCIHGAAMAECARYRDAAACADAVQYEVCFDAQTFEEYFAMLGRFFCGAGLPAKPDAGGGAIDGGRYAREGARPATMPVGELEETQAASNRSRSGIGSRRSVVEVPTR